MTVVDAKRIQDYYKNEDGFVMNTHYKDGDKVTIAQGQAKYMLPPLGNELRTTKSKNATAKPSSTTPVQKKTTDTKTN